MSINYDKIRMEFFIEMCNRLDAMGFDANEVTEMAKESTNKFMKKIVKEHKEEKENTDQISNL